uniref:EF-hand domain-containing protein n=1 Tax=Quercus lobata TaxID=97700 RepID=A0A7N2MH93_QUELO
MANAVVYALIATAFFIIMVFSPSRQHGRDHRGLNRRLGYEFRITNFDPLVSKLERLAENRGQEDPINSTTSSFNFENGSFVDEVDDAYEYFSEGKLNTTLRLYILFPLIDKAPTDGVVSCKELEAWFEHQAHQRLIYTTQKEMASRDKDVDGAIAFNEYLPQFFKEDIECETEKNGMGHGEAGWWKEQFDNADIDRSGSLSFDEFKDFLHPEDSGNEKIQKWLLREKIKRMDNDGDGKLNFEEFLDHAYDIYKNYADFESRGADVPTAEEKFAELDVNKDKLLVVEELKPMLGYLHPGELTYAKYYTSYLIHEADDNKDGNLSLDEMLNHEHILYNTVFDESKEDYDDDFHDEL